MIAYIKIQTENLKFPESGFSLDKIMRLSINFHRLALTRGSSYTEFPRCFKWAVIAALHHEEIKHNPERIGLLRSYENHYD